MRILYCLLLSLCMIASVQDAYARSETHAFTSFEMEDLESVRSDLKSKNSQSAPALRSLLGRADAAAAKPATSPLDKRLTAPSGDKHDFYSIGAYSWPDESKGRSAPYIRRDGHKNPEAYGSDYDKGRFNAMVNDVNTLSLAYYYTGNKRYSDAAAQLLRAWFILRASKLNANLKHAASQPGVNDGYYGGIIEGVVLIEMLDYVQLIAESGSLSKSDMDSLRSWFLDFSTWLVKSEFGKKESESRNNHGTWYADQVMAFSLFGGDQERAKWALDLAKKNLRVQFDPDGSMPREMKRSNSFMYAVYGLRAFVVAAQLSEALGDSLWHFPSGVESPMKKSFYFLSPYFSGGRKWTGAMIDKDYDQYSVQIFRLASKRYHTQPFADVVAYLTEHLPLEDRYARLLGPATVRASGAEQSFDYPQPRSLGSIANGGSGWTDGWRVMGGKRVQALGLIDRALFTRHAGQEHGSGLVLDSGGEMILSRSFALPRAYAGEDYYVSVKFRVIPAQGKEPGGPKPFMSIGLAGEHQESAGPLAIFGKKDSVGVRSGRDQFAKESLSTNFPYCAVLAFSDWAGPAFSALSISIAGQPGLDVDAEARPRSTKLSGTGPLRVLIRARSGQDRHFLLNSLLVSTKLETARAYCMN